MRRAARLIALALVGGLWSAPASAGITSIFTLPSGSNTQVQFNDSGYFGADSGLTYNKTTDTLTPGAISVSTITVSSFTATHSIVIAGNILSSTTISALNTLGDSRAVITDSNGSPTTVTTTAAEILFVNGVTSNIQTQFSTKASTSNPSFTGTLTQSGGAVSLSSTTVNGQLIGRGTPTNDNAGQFDIGYSTSATLTFANRFTLTANVPVSVATMTLTAGDYALSGDAGFVGGTNTKVSSFQWAISATANTLPATTAYTPDSSGQLRCEIEYPNGGQVFTGNFTQSVPPFPTYRASFSGNQTLYLVFQSSFSVSTNQAFGSINAVRRR